MLGFFLAIATALLVGLTLRTLFETGLSRLGHREGAAIVTLTWLTFSLRARGLADTSKGRQRIRFGAPATARLPRRLALRLPQALALCGDLAPAGLGDSLAASPELREGPSQRSLIGQLALGPHKLLRGGLSSLTRCLTIAGLGSLGQPSEGLRQVDVTGLCSSGGRLGQRLAQRLALRDIHLGQLLSHSLQRLGRISSDRLVDSFGLGQALELRGQRLHGCLAASGIGIQPLAQSLFHLGQVGQCLFAITGVGAELLGQLGQLAQ